VVHLADQSRLVEAWQNLFLVLGSTAASLIGLVFVAVSVGVSLKQPRKGLGEFTGQTIVNFTIALGSCVVTLSPAGLKLCGSLLVVVGMLGLCYAVWFWWHMQLIDGYEQVKTDWLYYGLLPVVNYALLTLTAVDLSIFANATIVYMLAAALLLLIVLCIRNSYELTIWAAMQK
jgi:hypothetical protein